MGGSNSNENNPSLFVTSNVGEGPKMGDSKFVNDTGENHRKALSCINQNIMGATHYPLVVNKKDISGVFVLRKHETHEKNSFLGPGQVTRTLGEQKDSKQHLFSQEIETSTTLASKSNFLEDHIIIDVEECPMFVKYTEAILDEVDRMEVEMENEDSSIMDIDSADLKDPLAAVEYVDDIYAFYRKIESCSCVSPNYMDHQLDINEKMRAILIDWLIEVHYKFKLMEETLFLTVNLIDRFLDRHEVARKKLQLVGMTAMLIACKYEEVSVPIVDDFVLISDNAYTREDVLDMEKLMVNSMQFNMSVPTPYVFMRRFLKAAQADRKLELLSFFIIELCLVEYEMLKFPPSLLAAAAIYTAQCSLYRFTQWTITCEWHTNYSEEELMVCSRLMVGLHQKAGSGKLNGVHKKYSTSMFGHAAKAEPAWFLY